MRANPSLIVKDYNIYLSIRNVTIISATLMTSFFIKMIYESCNKNYKFDDITMKCDIDTLTIPFISDMLRNFPKESCILFTFFSYFTML